MDSRKLISGTNTSAVCTALPKFTPACLPVKEQLAHLHISPSVTLFKSCVLSIRSWIPVSCLRLSFVNFLGKHSQEIQELKSSFGHSHTPMAVLGSSMYYHHLETSKAWKWPKEHLDVEAFYTTVYLELCRASIHRCLQSLCVLATVPTATSQYFNCSSKPALALPKRSVCRLYDLIQLGDRSLIHLFYHLLQLFSTSTKCTYVLISKRACHLFSLAVSKEIIFLLLIANYIKNILVSIFI